MKTWPLYLQQTNQQTQLTSKQGESILKELADIRTVLERIEKQAPAGRNPAIPKTASAAINDRPALGKADAGVTVVEFTDYQCPFCRRFYSSTFKQLKKTYIDSGKVRWIVLDLPLNFHKDAWYASEAALCAGEQGKFWQLREIFYKNQDKLQPEHIARFARETGIAGETFDDCLASKRYQQTIQQDITAAEKEQITGTPTFIIARSSAGVVKGKRIIGAQSYKVFSNEIESLLR